MKFEILNSIEESLPLLVVIFVVVFTIIFLTRLILTYLLNKAVERYHALKRSDKNFFKKKTAKFKKEEDELLRKKDELPRAHSAVKEEMKRKGQQGSYELMISKEQEQEKEAQSEVTIVDIVKPIGFWTSMILGQKLTYLIQSAQTINKRDKQGFWVSMIEAKDRAAGRQKGR